MKSITLFTVTLVLSKANLTQLTTLDCQEGKIANSQKICIEPTYIGDAQYMKIQQYVNNAQMDIIQKINGRCDFVTKVQTKIIGCLNYAQNRTCVNCANEKLMVNANMELKIVLLMILRIVVFNAILNIH